MKLRSAIRLVLRIVLWPVAFAALMYLLLLLINRRDRPASAQALSLVSLYRTRAPVPDADNGYVYLKGIGYIHDHDPVLREKGERAAFATLRDGCREMDRACEGVLASHSKEIRSALEDNAWTLARYRELILRSSWQGDAINDIDHGALKLVSAAVGQQLLMIDAWNRARAGDAGAVGAALAQDHRFWRMVLASSDDLFCKVYARSAVRRNLLMGNVVLAQLPRARQEAAVPAQWRQPVSARERSLMLPMVGEYRFNLKVLDGMAGEAAASEAPMARPGWAAAFPLVQRQDSMNEWAALILPHVALLDVGYRDFPAALARVRALEATPPKVWSLELAYNPIGRFMMRSGVGQLSNYGARLADLEGVRRGTLLAVELRSVGVALDRVADYVAAASLRNPYDGKPFGWDARTQSVTFTGQEPGERGTSALVY